MSITSRRMSMVGYLYKNGNLLWMPIHALNFILNFKAIILNKIYYRDYSVFIKCWEMLLELWILPPSNKIVLYKEFKFRFEVLNELN